MSNLHLAFQVVNGFYSDIVLNTFGFKSFYNFVICGEVLTLDHYRGFFGISTVSAVEKYPEDKNENGIYAGFVNHRSRFSIEIR